MNYWTYITLIKLLRKIPKPEVYDVFLPSFASCSVPEEDQFCQFLAPSMFCLTAKVRRPTAVLSSQLILWFFFMYCRVRREHRRWKERWVQRGRAEEDHGPRRQLLSSLLLLQTLTLSHPQTQRTSVIIKPRKLMIKWTETPKSIQWREIGFHVRKNLKLQP